MAKFEGVCVGGPRHGEVVSGYDTRLRFPKRRPLNVAACISDIPRYEPVEVDTYDFATMHFDKGDLSYWRHDSLPSHYEALQIMLSAVSATK